MNANNPENNPDRKPFPHIRPPRPSPEEQEPERLIIRQAIVDRAVADFHGEPYRLALEREIAEHPFYFELGNFEENVRWRLLGMIIADDDNAWIELPNDYP